MTWIGRTVVEVPCTVEIEQTPESLHADVTLDAGFNIEPGNEVHAVGLYGARRRHLGADGARAPSRCDRGHAWQGLRRAWWLQHRIEPFVRFRAELRLGLHLHHLPPAVAAGAAASIRRLQESGVERARHQERVARVRQALDTADIPTLANRSHIVPVMVGDPVL